MSGQTEHRHEYIKRLLPERITRKKDGWVANPTKLEDLTNYRQDYAEKKVPPTKSCKPDETPLQSEAPLSDKSTQRVDYQRWPCTKVDQCHPEHNLYPCGDMDMLSTNRAEFIEKPIRIPASCRPPANRGALPKFVGRTENRDCFGPKEMGPILRPTMKGEFIPSEEPLENLTNYRMNYVPRSQAVRSSMKPAENDWSSDEPLGNSSYRHDYIRMPLPPRIEREKEKFVPNPTKLADNTVYRDHYAKKLGRPSTSCKPSDVPYMSEAPIEKATTQRVDYQPWKEKRPPLFNPESNLFPCGDMDMTTTNRAEFTEKPIRIPASCRPPANRGALPKFVGRTENRDCFGPKEMGPILRPTMKGEFIPSEEPLENLTNYRMNYVPRSQAVRSSMKPAENDWSSDEPLGNSSYRHDYIRMPLPPRIEREKEKFVPNPTKLADNTVYRDHYAKKLGRPSTSCKPSDVPYMSEAPIEKATTQRVDYQPWKEKRPPLFNPESNLFPCGDMDMTTTNRAEFTEKPIRIPASCRPPANRGALPKFVGRTENRDCFGPKEMGPILRPTMKGEFIPSEEPLENLTNYRMNYVPRSQAVRSSMKPAENDWSSDEPLGNSSYRHDYIRMPLPPRIEREKEKFVPNPTKLADNTVYRDHYAKKFGRPSTSCKPSDVPYMSEAPIEKATTQRVDYQPWKEKRPPLFNPESNLFPCGDMDMTTTNRAEFTEKPIRIPASCRPPANRGALPKFVGRTENRDCFGPKEMGPILRPTMKGEFIPSEEPLENLTNYRMNYVPRSQAVRSSMKPAENDWSSDEPLGNSSYRHDYIRMPLPPRIEREKEKFVPNPTKLADNTVYRDHYAKKLGRPSTSCKPSDVPYMSEAPIEKATTQRVDYQPWKEKRPPLFNPESNLFPCGDMDMTTTNRAEFTEKPIRIPASCRPPANRGALPKFVGRTENRDCFGPKEMGPILRPTMKGEFIPSEEPLENLTNYRMNYVPRSQAVRSSMKPAENDWSSDEPLGNSSYRHDYIRMPLPPRIEREKEKFVPNPTKLADNTVYRDHYAKKLGRPSTSCKPSDVPYMSEAPIEKATTQRVDYQPWKEKRPPLFNPESNLFPCGDMDMMTTNRANFTEKPICVRQPYKVTTRSLPGRFQGKSNYRHDFQDHKLPKPELMHGKCVFIPSECPLADCTTYRGAFVRKQPQSSRVWIPTDNKRLLY